MVQGSSAATKAVIQAAAIKCIEEVGFKETTLKRVAAKAGVSISTVHHYYKGRDELFESCIAEMYEAIDKVRSLFARAVREEKTIEKMVEVLALTVLDFAREFRTEIRLLVRAYAEKGDYPEQFRNKWIAKLAESLEELGMAKQDALSCILQTWLIIRPMSIMSNDEVERVMEIEGPDAKKELHDQLVKTILAMVQVRLPDSFKTAS